LNIGSWTGALAIGRKIEGTLVEVTLVRLGRNDGAHGRDIETEKGTSDHCHGRDHVDVAHHKHLDFVCQQTIKTSEVSKRYGKLTPLKSLEVCEEVENHGDCGGSELFYIYGGLGIQKARWNVGRSS